MVSQKSKIIIPSKEEVEEYSKAEPKIKQDTKFKDASVDIDKILETTDGKIHQDF